MAKKSAVGWTPFDKNYYNNPMTSGFGIMNKKKNK